MMIGAHPDDEDSALLAYLARGESARTAYLSLTRGDGGQNIVGPELFEALGVIRTEELLQARRLDGAEQYFARAFDYGFSKTLAEAKQKWPEEIIKCDTVRAIRQFKPQVVISLWSGTPSDGHGQHQYSGYISPIAVRAAADATQCTDAGPAWQVQKFYVERGSGTGPALRINVGKYDPLLGRSYFEIAMEGRSQHRSQGEGRIEYRGDQFSTLRLVESKIVRREKPETSIFDGIDIGGKSVTIPTDRDSLSDRTSSITNLLPQKHSNLGADEVMLRNALGIQIDALADRETIARGENIGVGVKVYLHGLAKASVSGITWTSQAGLQVTAAEPPSANSSAYNARESADFAGYFNVKVPTSALPTQPYWLTTSRSGDMFEWPRDDRQTLSFDPPALVALVHVSVGDKELTFSQPVEYRMADPSRGELRRDLNVVPAVSVALDHALVIVPAGGSERMRRIVLTVTNNSSSPLTGTASINKTGGGGLKISTASNSFDLKSKGERASIPFDLTVPANTSPGIYAVSGSVEIGGSRFDREMHTIAYPHIQTHRFYTRAQANVEVIDLKTASVSVGYIMGSGDEVPDAITEMGVKATLLDEKYVASGDLSKFDTIVVGIRASETRPDFVANNARLLDYVRNGGNLIVQYQRGNFGRSGLLPFSADTQDRQGTGSGSTSRVVDENAPVKILAPDHPIFNFPNKITDQDFLNWVQERNLYNLVTFDSQFTPLLESHDAGEQPNNGGMVIATLGKGTYIYTSYSWFRQLPAGVPGAYRIFANLLSLPKALKKS
jgi:LmbE family N-acetylglucosaminyl deacetylase